MAVKRFSKGEAVRYGWRKMSANLGFFIGLIVIAFLISFFFSGFAGLFDKRLPSLSLIFNIGSLFFSVFISIIYLKVSLNICDGDRGGMRDILSLSLPLFFKFLLAMVLYYLIVAAGLILFIVPGYYFMIKYQFVLYLIVDKGMDVVPAFNMSSQITKGVKWQLLFFDLLIGVIVLAGILLFFVGFFVAFPTALFASIFVYRKLSSVTGVSSDSPFQAPAPAS